MKDEKKEEKFTGRGAFHVVTVNREGFHSPKNTVEIDGKPVKGITNVKIVFGIDNPYPIVTIEFLAKELQARIESRRIEEWKSLKKKKYNKKELE